MNTDENEASLVELIITGKYTEWIKAEMETRWQRSELSLGNFSAYQSIQSSVISLLPFSSHDRREHHLYHQRYYC